MRALFKSMFVLSAWAVGAVSRVQPSVIPAKAQQGVLGTNCALCGVGECDHFVYNQAGLSGPYLAPKPQLSDGARRLMPIYKSLLSPLGSSELSGV